MTQTDLLPNQDVCDKRRYSRLQDEHFVSNLNIVGGRLGYCLKKNRRVVVNFPLAKEILSKTLVVTEHRNQS